MRHDPPQRAWQISQVQRLIGLKRRDIQRACYAGPGGAAILAPADGSWGRRSYGVGDLARLFMVARHRERGRTLAEARQALGDLAGEGGWAGALEAEVEQLREQCARDSEEFVQGEVLLWAMRAGAGREVSPEEEGLGDVLETLVGKGIAVSRLLAGESEAMEAPAVEPKLGSRSLAAAVMRLACGAGGAPQAQEGAGAADAFFAPPVSRASAAEVASVLDAPGMELAVEVVLGEGAYDRARLGAEELMEGGGV